MPRHLARKRRAIYLRSFRRYRPHARCLCGRDHAYKDSGLCWICEYERETGHPI